MCTGPPQPPPAAGRAPCSVQPSQFSGGHLDGQALGQGAIEDRQRLQRRQRYSAVDTGATQARHRQVVQNGGVTGAQRARVTHQRTVGSAGGSVLLSHVGGDGWMQQWKPVQERSTGVTEPGGAGPLAVDRRHLMPRVHTRTHVLLAGEDPAVRAAPETLERAGAHRTLQARAVEVAAQKDHGTGGSFIYSILGIHGATMADGGSAVRRAAGGLWTGGHCGCFPRSRAELTSLRAISPAVRYLVRRGDTRVHDPASEVSNEPTQSEEGERKRGRAGRAGDRAGGGGGA